MGFNKSNDLAESSLFSPLLKALNLLCFRLEHAGVSDAISNIVIATATLSELRQQKLSAHIKTSVRKRRGPRVSTRGARNLRLTRLVRARWPQDHQLENTVSALAYVLNGRADFHIEDYVLQCEMGDFLFIPAGIAKPDAGASYVLDGSDRQCDLLWVYPGPLKGDGVECWVCHSQGKNAYTGVEYGSSAVKSRFVSQLFEELDEELQRESAPEFRWHLLSCLLLWLKREIAEGRAELPYTRRLHQPVERVPDFIEQACKHIASNLDSPLTISRISRIIGVSPATFTRNFRVRIGCSFNEYLTQQRLEGAESLLKDTTLPVSDVARHVGLQYERLRLIFYQKHHCSPGEFRKRQK